MTIHWKGPSWLWEKHNRRQLGRGAALLFVGKWMSGHGATAAPNPGSLRIGPDLYASLGVHPIINARGTVTIIGGSRMLPEVKRAMEEATRHYVHLDELMEGVSRRLAQLTGADWGIVTAGATAALTLATAACVAGSDPDKIARLPDLRGMKDEVIIPTYSRIVYDHGVRAVGVRVVEAGTPEQLERALGPRTAMVMVLGGPAADQPGFGLEVIAKTAHKQGVPVLVDAASEALRVPNPHLKQGADLVAYSGGKALRGPQCSGMLIGRKDLVQSAWLNGAPHHGFARGMKVGREEIIGLLAAVEMWAKRDHDAEWKQWTAWLEQIANRVRKIPGVATEIRKPEGLVNYSPMLRITWDTKRIPLSGLDVETLLYEGSPRVAVSGAGSFLPFPPNFDPYIEITPYQLEAGEEKIIAERVFAVLSNPVRKSSDAAPAAQVAGLWDVHIDFLAGSADHQFTIEQDGSQLAGTHHGEYVARDLGGTIQGNEVLIRSWYTKASRLTFTFTGAVQKGDTMSGEVSLGQYGTARWRAKRHPRAALGMRETGLK